MCRYMILALMALFSICSAIDDAKLEMLRKVGAAICLPNLASNPEKLKLVTDCEAIVPIVIRDVYHGCIREVLGINDINLPIFCYKVAPGNAEKLESCLKGREDSAATQGIIVDEKKEAEFKARYMRTLLTGMYGQRNVKRHIGNEFALMILK